MEDKLKENVNPEGFHYPSDYETMSVDTAYEFLDLAKDGHGMVFEPDSFAGFQANLVLKCGVDLDYVFGDDFVSDKEEVKKHMATSQLPHEELVKEVQERVNKLEEERAKLYIQMFIDIKWNNLSKKEKFIQTLSGKRPTPGYLNSKSLDELMELYRSYDATPKKDGRTK